jgi:hypothetical protein
MSESVTRAGKIERKDLKKFTQSDPGATTILVDELDQAAEVSGVRIISRKYAGFTRHLLVE